MNLAEKVDEMMSAGEHLQVGEMLRRALEQARATRNAADELCVLNEQLGYYRSTGQNEKALETCESVLAYLKFYQGYGDEDFATTLLNTATAYRAAGQTEKALELYLMAEQVYAEVLEPGDVRYAALYNNAALACRENNQPTQTKIYLSRAVEILEQAGDGYAGELAVTLSNLGLMQMGAGEYDLAETHLNRALELFETAGDDPHRAAALAGMANLHCLRGGYQAAIALYLESLEVTERFFGRNGDYRITCRNCERAATAAGETALAREMHLRGEGG